jgi:transposase-like protein
MEERGVKVDHSTLNRWVIRYSSSLVLAAKKCKRAVVTSLRMDETYIKIKGKWVHRFIKKITNPMMGFKAFNSAKATIDGIETAHMIRKEQLSENIPAYKQFMALAG